MLTKVGVTAGLLRQTEVGRLQVQPLEAAVGKSRKKKEEEEEEEQGDDDIDLSIPAPSASAASNQRCALLFFGLAKKFQEIVLPTISSSILKHNPECDVYVHTYNVTSVSNPRNNEK